MIKFLSKSHLSALFLLLASFPAHSSIYDIICVECTLTAAEYQFNDPSLGYTTSGGITVPGASTDFEIANFFGQTLTAHDVNFYWGAGTYAFDSIGDSVIPGQSISMTVNAGQIGMHFLFDWNANTNIDVLNVFDVIYLNGDMTLTPVDMDGNGIVGFRMVEGPFFGDYIATSFVVATPVPAALWLFGSGLIGLVGFAKRKSPNKCQEASWLSL